jgi:2-polyprenyl-3-methyl-5-hydroxy-6-metoxy-1,4-benzoquinol methylase
MAHVVQAPSESKLNHTPPSTAPGQPGSGYRLSARIEPFDSFWEGPEDVEEGYSSFRQFYRANYLPRLPADTNSRILVISCGPGYLLNLLRSEGYSHVLGIDSMTEKIQYALAHELNGRVAEAFAFLHDNAEMYDLIFCEQELNHLTKDEMVVFLGLCRHRLNPNGMLIVHGLNGANPITGAEALAQNIDHFNTFTDYSLRQLLAYCGFEQIQVFSLNLYVFPTHPLNWLAMAAAGALHSFFRLCFILYGKKNRMFTKKIAAVCWKSE